MVDFKAWRASLVARGFFKPRPVWQLVWFLAEPLAFVTVGCWLMKITGNVLPGKLLHPPPFVRFRQNQHVVIIFSNFRRYYRGAVTSGSIMGASCLRRGTHVS